jgi:cellulose biosynthesis protein BcsQ
MKHRSTKACRTHSSAAPKQHSDAHHHHLRQPQGRLRQDHLGREPRRRLRRARRPRPPHRRRPQANLSETFGLDREPEHPTLEHALTTKHARLQPAPWSAPPIGTKPAREHHHLDLIPTTEALATTAAQNATNPGFATRLAELLEQDATSYDVVLIDTPPGLTPLATMAMLAADWVIAPARPADFDVGGAVKLADLIDDELSVINPELRLLGVLITQADRRWTLTQDTRDALNAAGIKQLRTEIPFMVRVGAAPRHAAPTIALEPDNRVSCAYRELARDLAAALRITPDA